MELAWVVDVEVVVIVEVMEVKRTRPKNGYGYRVKEEALDDEIDISVKIVGWKRFWRLLGLRRFFGVIWG